MRILVMAKEPVAGRVKTRLTPPYSPQQAADLAAAALEDTLAAAAQVERATVVLVLSGDRPSFVDPSLPVVPQRGEGLAERLSAAFDDTAAAAATTAAGADAGHVLLVGMDTPQVTPELLSSSLAALAEADSGGAPVAALGDAPDGGWWALGLSRPSPRLLDGVPMSEPTTGAATRARLVERGYRVVDLPVLRDVDEVVDARAVAGQATGSRFAQLVRRLDRTISAVRLEAPA